MKIKYDCFPCILRQVLEASRMVTDDKKLIRKMINKFAQMVPEISEEESAPMVVSRIQSYIKEITGEADPYQKFKEEHIQLALRLYPDVKKIVDEAEDSLKAALIMAAMANSIDAGVSLKVALKENINKAGARGFAYSDYKQFQQKLRKHNNVLIIADNSGEAVFDRLLIQELTKFDVNITYAVREKPILNDVTVKEAREIGLDKICNLIKSGCRAPGMLLQQASDEFMEIYHHADIRISKGQGNLEGLSDEDEPIFFLLQAKCELVTNLLKVNKGDLVLKLEP